MTDCEHKKLMVTRNAAGTPVRVICPCDEEWRVVPIEPSWDERARLRDWLDRMDGRP